MKVKEFRPMKKYLYKQIHKQINLLLLLNISILFLSACTSGSVSIIRNPAPETPKDPQPVDTRLDEGIIFIGPINAGKSTLCNSIFGKAKCPSAPPATLNTGCTFMTKEHAHAGKLYIDTKGLNPLDFTRPPEEALKKLSTILNECVLKPKGFKLVICVSYSGYEMKKMKEIIDYMCDIDNSIEYGIIINKEHKTSGLIKLEIQSICSTLKKQPTEIEFLEEEPTLTGKKDEYFTSDSDNRKKLVAFLDKLKINKTK
jgi:GTP-binding protein EngB required for normal cell division